MRPLLAENDNFPSWACAGSEGSNISIFHTDAWARVLEATYGHSRFVFPEVGKKSGGAFFPVMEIRSRWTGCRGVSMPFSDACSMPGEKAGAKQELFEEAVEMGKRRGWRYLEIRGESGLFSHRPASDRYYGHELKLSADLGKLFGELDSSARRAVRKAEGSGLTVEFSRSVEAVGSYYELHCRTRRRQGAPPQPWLFFENIQKQMLAREFGWVVLARWRGRAVAGAVFFNLKPKALYKYGASDERFQAMRPNNLVMWRALEHYAREGYTDFDFGRTDRGHHSLRRFKMGWGAKEQLIAYYKYDCQSGKFLPGKRRSWVKSHGAMSRLPVPVLTLMGSLLYRHLQ